MLVSQVTVSQSQRSGCVWKPGFDKFNYIIYIHSLTSKYSIPAHIATGISPRNTNLVKPWITRSIA